MANINVHDLAAAYELDEEKLMEFFNIKDEPEPEPEVILYKCPKSYKCIMACEHREPHEHSKHCHGVDEDPAQCPNCVEELKADVTFFEDDFKLD